MLFACALYLLLVGGEGNAGYLDCLMLVIRIAGRGREDADVGNR